MNRVLHSTANVKNAVLGVQVTAPQTGASVDRFNYRDAILHVLVANVTGAPTAKSVAVKVQHSETDVPGDFVDVVIQGQAGEIVVTDTEGELHLNLDGFKQYVRVIATPAFTGGTTPKADIVGTIVLGNKVSNPVRTV